ncbi:hypothetical protein COL922a_008670 [Colletotrichum nupharicola]|nr:hypothetical protein COL922a_008670 [Colletotrichum nupharicola]
MDIEKLIGNPPFKLDDGDIRALRGQFDDFPPHTWDELQNVIAQGGPIPASTAPLTAYANQLPETWVISEEHPRSSEDTYCGLLR